MYIPSFPTFLCDLFTKWLPEAILDVQNSLAVAFLAITDPYEQIC